MTNSKGKNVMVAMSGGIDSTASAMLLKEQGYHCRGVYMQTSGDSKHPRRYVREVADKLEIDLDVLDLREDFEKVVNYFCREYESGRTPNPCVYCNRYIKFGKLIEYALSRGTDYFATGHYARIIRKEDDTGLYCGKDESKDQSYALAMINKNALDKLLLPLGDYDKQRAREIVSELGINLENRSESQEICFIPDDDYIGFLEKHIPQLAEKGKIIDSEGSILGEHNGTHRYTIGQRRGLGVAMGVPYYVTRIDPESNTVTLGPEEEVMHSRITATDVNRLTQPVKEQFRAKVKIRYNSKPQEAVVTSGASGFTVEFDEKVKAATPGQLAVVYGDEPEGERVLCGGWIEKAAE